jgi:hypothetical protein
VTFTTAQMPGRADLSLARVRARQPSFARLRPAGSAPSPGEPRDQSHGCGGQDALARLRDAGDLDVIEEEVSKLISVDAFRPEPHPLESREGLREGEGPEVLDSRSVQKVSRTKTRTTSGV